VTTACGIYFDGEVARGCPVTLDFSDCRQLRIAGDGVALESNLADIRVSDRLGDIPRFLYLPGGAVVETHDNAVIDAVLGNARRRRASLLIHALESRQWIAAIGCVVLTAAILTLAFFAPPFLARVVAKRVPADVDERIGATGLATIRTYFAASQLTAAERERVQQQLVRLEADPGVPRPRIEFLSMNGGLPNAFALPGNVIVVTDELVRLPATDDEIAAVLAHELGHLEKRHGLQTVLRSSFAVLIVAAVTGDFSTLTSFAGTIPMTILTAGYSRDSEREADRYALALLRARGIKPRAFVTVLVKLEASRDSLQRNSTYVSTHPATKERTALFGGITSAERKAVLAERWLDWAAKAMQQHDPALALVNYTKAIELSPTAETYLLRAKCQRTRGDNDAFEADVAKALEFDRKSVEAHVLRLEFLTLARKRYDTAMAEARETLAIAPNNAEVIALLGYAEMMKGDTAAAAKEFDRAIKSDPADAHGWMYRATLRERNGDVPAALADLEVAVKADPDAFAARYQRGVLRSRQHKYAEALPDFESVPAASRVWPAYFIERGWAEQQLGMLEQARADYTEGLGKRPTPETRVALQANLAGVHNLIGDFRAAISSCDAALAIDAKCGAAYFERGRARLRTGEVALGLADLEQAAGAGFDERLVDIERGRAKWKSGRFLESARDLTRVLEKGPLAEAYKLRGLDRFSLGQWREADADFSSALTLLPDAQQQRYVGYFRLLARRLGDLDDGEPEFVQSVKEAPPGWTRTVGRYLAGEIKAADLLAQVRPGGTPGLQERRCEADFYIGMMQLIAGDRKGAEERLHQCVETGMKNYFEYDLARGQLTRLQPGI
jgi:predicted Zn-dependent protease